MGRFFKYCMAIAMALTILVSDYAVFAEGTAVAEAGGTTAAVEAGDTGGTRLDSARPGINENDLIYFVLTDRFYDGDTSNDEGADKNDPSGYHGGDFQGIIDKLDYIKDLGFTTIWISPVVKNQIRGYHGYWALDFYKTNEHFGDMAKLKELVNTANSKGIKVMFDLVVNHTGVMHPWVSDPNMPGGSIKRRISSITTISRKSSRGGFQGSRISTRRIRRSRST